MEVVSLMIKIDFYSKLSVENDLKINFLVLHLLSTKDQIIFTECLIQLNISNM